MTVGTLHLELYIPEARSLKAKRRILKSLKDRISNRYSVSIAEVNFHDQWQRAGVGIAMVGTDGGFINSALSRIVDFVRLSPDVCLSNHSLEIF